MRRTVLRVTIALAWCHLLSLSPPFLHLSAPLPLGCQQGQMTCKLYKYVFRDVTDWIMRGYGYHFTAWSVTSAFHHTSLVSWT